MTDDWFGTIPTHWKLGSIRRFAAMRTGHTPSRSTSEYWVDCTIPWFTLADVWQLRAGARDLGETGERISVLGLANSAAELLPAGTVILSRTASVGFSGIMQTAMATSQDFWNWVPGNCLRSEFLWYQLQAMRSEFDRLMIGSTHRTIYQADAAALRIAVPPVEEQQAIVEYLDRETAQIDTFIARNEELIGLLTERRVAKIDSAMSVTQGHGTMSLRRVLAVSQTGPFGTQLSADEYQSGGIPIINPTHIVRGALRPDPDISVGEGQATRLARFRLQAGDIVLGRKGEVDKSAITPAEMSGAVCGSDSIMLRPSEYVSSEYLWWFLQSARAHVQLELFSVGSTVAGLNQQTLRSVRIPVPSRSTQSEIVRDLTAASRHVDQAIATARHGIDLARERRAALISAAVTGKIDVGVAA